MRTSSLYVVSLVALALTLTLAGCGSRNTNTAGSGSGGSGRSGGSGASGGSGSGGSGGGSPASSTWLYVNNENTSSNSASIYAYSVASNGSLTPVSGSPFSSTQAGAMAVSGNYLYAAEASGTLVTYSIASSGALKHSSSIDGGNDNPGGGSPVQPFTDGSSGKFLYSYYINDDDNGFQTYSVDNGDLTFENEVGSDLSAEALVFTANGQYGYTVGCYQGTPDMEGYSVASNGTLSQTWSPQQPPQPVGATAAYCPSNIAVSGNDYAVLVEQPTDDITSTGPPALYVYAINSSDGSLSTTQNASAGVPNGVGDTASSMYGVGAIGFDPTGSWLAVAGPNGIAIFSFKNGTLTQTGTAPTSGTAIDQLAWDNNGHLFGLGTLYSTSSPTTTLYVFNVKDGVPTAAPGSPITNLPQTGSGDIAVSSGTQTEN
jgi:hypothetical protein